MLGVGGGEDGGKLTTSHKQNTQSFLVSMREKMEAGGMGRGGGISCFCQY